MTKGVNAPVSRVPRITGLPAITLGVLAEYSHPFQL
jgi:hypothetical protein